jgi:hypothetical protein
MTHTRESPELPGRFTGLQDWGQDIDPMGKSWEIDAEGAAVSWRHVFTLCPEIHTYRHTQQFPKIVCHECGDESAELCERWG